MLTTNDDKVFSPDKATKYSAALEAALFAYGEPWPIKKAAELLAISVEQAAALAKELQRSLTQNERGLRLIIHQDRLQLVTAPDFNSFIEQLVKNETREELTPAAQETLAIVAYGGPISRAGIESVRGVNSSFMLRGLLIRGLINRAVSPQNANAYVYEITLECLKHLGIQSVKNLPDYNKYYALLTASSAETSPPTSG